MSSLTNRLIHSHTKVSERGCSVDELFNQADPGGLGGQVMGDERDGGMPEEMDGIDEIEAGLLARVYTLILSWADPQEEPHTLPGYCTQNDGKCRDCPQ